MVLRRQNPFRKKGPATIYHHLSLKTLPGSDVCGVGPGLKPPKGSTQSVAVSQGCGDSGMLGFQSKALEGHDQERVMSHR